MKSYNEFKANFKGIKEDNIKKAYEKYKKDNFNTWLSQYDTEEINRVGLDIYWKIFEAMCDDV